MDAAPNGRPPPGEPAERRAKFAAGRCRPHEPQLLPALGVVQLSADARGKSTAPALPPPPAFLDPALRAQPLPGAGAPSDGSTPQPGTAAPRPAGLPSARSPLRRVPSPGEMVSISTPISALGSARQPWARLGSARPDPQCRHAPPRPADGQPPAANAGQGRGGAEGGRPPPPAAPWGRGAAVRCGAVQCGAMLGYAVLCCAVLYYTMLGRRQRGPLSTGRAAAPPPSGTALSFKEENLCRYSVAAPMM